MKSIKFLLVLLVLSIGNNTEAQILKKLKNKLEKAVTGGKGQSLEADLHLQTSVEPAVSQIGGAVTFTFAVNNKGPETSDSIAARVIIPKSYSITNIKVSQGTYNETTQLWEVGSLEAWKRAEMTVLVTVNDGDDLMTTGEIISCTTKDPDSTPNNGIDTNGNGLIIDDRQDEDDADGQNIALGELNENIENKTAGAVDKPSKNTKPEPIEKLTNEKLINTSSSDTADNNIKLPESYPFSYQSTLHITNSKGVQEVIYFLEPEQNYYARKQNESSYSEHVVFDNARNIEVYFAEIDGKKRRAVKRMDIIGKVKQIGAFRDSPNTKITAIGSKSVLGFECKGYKITSDAGTTELWITNQAPATAFRALFEARAAMPNSPFTKDTMIMEVVYTSADNSNNNYRMTCMEFKPSQQQFLINNYTE